MFKRSPGKAFSATGEVDFSTGSDSPVKADSSMRRFLTSNRRRSAGTLSPDCKKTMSPSESSSAGMEIRLPSRNTDEERESMLRMAFSALSALSS